jgi:drug/metabolite transporter (DMT)-like permease
MLPLSSAKGVGYEKVASQCCDDDTYNGPEEDVIATVAAAPARTSAAAHQNNLLQRAIAALWAHGGACVVLSALISATSVMLVKLLGAHVPVFEVTLVRGLLSFAATLLVARARRMTHVFGHKEHLALLVTRGLTGSVAMVLYYLSILLLPLADAASVFFTQPALTAVLARLMLGEPLGFKGAAGAVASFAGLLVLLHPPGLFGGGGHAAWGPKRVLGVASGALSAWVSAAAFITVRVIGKREAALTVAMHFHTFTIALSALPLLLGWPAPAVAPTLREAALLVAIAATSFVALLLLTRGLQLYGAARVAAINFSQVVYSYGARWICLFVCALLCVCAVGTLQCTSINTHRPILTLRFTTQHHLPPPQRSVWHPHLARRADVDRRRGVAADRRRHRAFNIAPRRRRR